MRDHVRICGRPGGAIPGSTQPRDTTSAQKITFVGRHCPSSILTGKSAHPTFNRILVLELLPTLQKFSRVFLERFTIFRRDPLSASSHTADIAFILA